MAERINTSKIEKMLENARIVMGIPKIKGRINQVLLGAFYTGMAIQLGSIIYLAHGGDQKYCIYELLTGMGITYSALTIACFKRNTGYVENAPVVSRESAPSV